MGKLNIAANTGISVTSDEATSTLNDVVKGKTALTSDSKDELGLGTLELTGTTNPAHVLKGDTFYSIDPHNKETGTMPKNPAQNKALNCGQSHVVPAGYTPGGTVTANSLASQTAGNLVPNKIIKGYYGWSNGVKIEGNITVSSVVSFKVAAYSTSQVIATWQNPSKGPYSGVVICAKTGGYPTGINDNRKYTGTGSNSALNSMSSTTISNLEGGQTYYFRIWMYCTCSAGDLYSGYLQTTGTPTAHGRQVFTSSGTFTVPANVRSINIHTTGGGGGTRTLTASGYGSFNGDGGAGGGYTSYKIGIAVSPGTQVQCIVGAGARAGYSEIGGTSSASINGVIVVTAKGGNTSGAWNRAGRSGGSGGGTGSGESGGNTPYAGGSNGSNGGGNSAGAGQGTSTREFGTGTLYAGGGGGGNGRGTGAAGGAGGGGNGGSSNGKIAPANGSAGTGGGGGGGIWRTQDAYSSSGGSGNVIITW